MTRATQALAEINAILKKYDLCLSPDESQSEIYVSDGYEPCTAYDSTDEAMHERHLESFREAWAARHRRKLIARATRLSHAITAHLTPKKEKKR